MLEAFCEVCEQDTGRVELEVLNVSAGDVLTCTVCETCAVVVSGARISYDSDGTPYSNLGCIGGAPEEIN
jgi:protein-arginine kinase activator protein McsA